MYSGQQGFYLCAIYTLILFNPATVHALKFEPGVGTGIEYTNNVELDASDKTGDTIAIAYVGASLAETEGALNYDVLASFNKNIYLKDTFEDTDYFEMSASANWEVVKNRFRLSLSNSFTQRPVDSFDVNTPDNIQDSNAFTLGSEIIFPISKRQRFTLVPSYSQSYFEVEDTNNKQYALAGNWNYKLGRLTDVGLSVSSREVDYSQNSLIETTDDARFTTVSIVFSKQYLHSRFSISLGSTRVDVEDGDEESGFSGDLSWSTKLSSRSSLNIDLSTELTDTSSAILNTNGTTSNNNVQITTGVVRDRGINLVYQREDASLRSSIRTEFREVDSTDGPEDQADRLVALTLDYPLSRLLTAGLYSNYDYSKDRATGEVDKEYSVGSRLQYSMSRKLNATFDMTYRKGESDLASGDFNEFSAFISLVYGFGQVDRPTQTATGF